MRKLLAISLIFITALFMLVSCDKAPKPEMHFQKDDCNVHWEKMYGASMGSPSAGIQRVHEDTIIVCHVLKGDPAMQDVEVVMQIDELQPNIIRLRERISGVAQNKCAYAIHIGIVNLSNGIYEIQLIQLDAENKYRRVLDASVKIEKTKSIKTD